MNLIYYTSNKGNFGDDLNKWLWPKLFKPEMFLDDDTAFLGIGSILSKGSEFIERANKHRYKIVFGTGVRSINECLQFDESWKIILLRGKYSSLKIEGEVDGFFADGAYFLAMLPDYLRLVEQEKKYEVSFVPYFQSVDKVDWKKICIRLGWNYISPSEMSVEKFIEEIAFSKSVVSEAMHGAIVADVLRVPWKRLRFYSHIYEGEKVSEFKWNDWLSSIDIGKNDYVDVSWPKRKKKHMLLKGLYQSKLEKNLLNKLKHHDVIDFNLSSDQKMEYFKEQMKLKMDILIDVYKEL